MSSPNLFSWCLYDLNTRRSTAKRADGGVANEKVLPRVDEIPIVGLGEENEEVPLQQPQVPTEPQKPHVP